jgi:hypothetical protein
MFYVLQLESKTLPYPKRGWRTLNPFGVWKSLGLVGIVFTSGTSTFSVMTINPLGCNTSEMIT